MNRNEKEFFIADMKSRLERAEAVFLVDYQGLNVEAMNRLRGELRKSDIEFTVVKNRLLKLASQGTTTESIQDQFSGPCALAIAYDDAVTPAKILIGVSKDYKELELKIGQISGKPITMEVMARLAALPSRDLLLAQVLSAMQAVPASFARVLNGVVVKLLNVMKAIETAKEKNDQDSESP